MRQRPGGDSFWRGESARGGSSYFSVVSSLSGQTISGLVYCVFGRISKSNLILFVLTTVNKMVDDVRKILRTCKDTYSREKDKNHSKNNAMSARETREAKFDRTRDKKGKRIVD